MIEAHLQVDKSDEIQPKISHFVDEISEDGRLLERYNYIIYEFVADGAYLSARTYLDEVGKVVIFGPFTDHLQKTKANAPDLVAAASNYLERRFRSVLRFEHLGNILR